MVDFFKSGFENKEGKMIISDTEVEKISAKYKTPLYVVNQKTIEEKCQILHNAISKITKNYEIHYAMKANSNISILKIIKNQGVFIDAVSIGEIIAAKKAGFKKSEIMFTGTSVSDEELEELSKMGVKLNFDSISALNRLLKIKVPKLISFRINPETGAGHHSHVVTGGPDTKFGIWEADAIEAYKKAKEAGVRKFGIHMHIGSNVFDFEDFSKALERFLEIAAKIKKETKIKFEFIDIGGGLGVPYKIEQKELDLEEFAQKVVGKFLTKCKELDLGEPKLIIEPGRFLVADSTVLLTRVNTIKKTPYKTFVGVDAGFNTLVRPAMYGSYHHIFVNGKIGENESEKYDIVGPICESGDFFAKDRSMPKIEEGDLLIIMTAGAYGYSMSSTYNLRPRAAEILINNSEISEIRKRETIKELMKNQI